MFNFHQLLQRTSDEILLHKYLFFVITLFSVWLLTKWLYKTTASRKNLPPSPPKLPVLGSLHQLSPLTHRSFQSLSAKYVPLMRLHFGPKPALIVSSADAAMEIMKTQDLVFANKPDTSVMRKIFYNLKDISVAPYGEYWRQLKSICILQLLNNKRVQSFHSVREEENALIMEKIREASLSSLSYDVISRSAFGRKYSDGENGKKFLLLLKEAMVLIATFRVGDFIPSLSWINLRFDARVDQVAKEIDDFLEAVVEEHLDGGLESEDHVKNDGRENFVDILLRIYKDNVAGISIDRDSIKAIILDIFAGGTDITSAALEWAMSELLRHPRVMDRLQNEVRRILNGREDITEIDLEKMLYLKAVIKETLRLHPPIPITSRKPLSDVKVRGYEIAAGATVIVNLWAIGRDPASWDEPEKFKPERFLNSSIDFKGLDFQLIPFGSGRRGCPGSGFAVAAIALVLANLVHKFDWKLPNGVIGDALDMTELPGVTTHRKFPLLAVPTQCNF